MEGLVQRLNLAAQGLNGGILELLLAVEPLAQGAGGGVHAAGELCAGVEGVAEVAGPFIVGDFRPLGAVQEGAGLDAGVLGAVDADDVHGGHAAEEQHSDDGGGHTDPDGSFDASTHSGASFYCCVSCSGTKIGGMASATRSMSFCSCVSCAWS